MILKRKALLIASSCIACMAASVPAHANKTVDAPYVDKGDAYAEWKGGYNIDNDDDVDGSWVQETNFGYGVTDWLNLEVGGAFTHDGADGGNTNYDATNAEARFELTDPGEYFVDAGVAVAYSKTKGDGPDVIETKLLLEKDIGSFQNRANLIFDREVGDDSSGETTYGFAWATAYSINENFAAGLEWYSDVGTFSGDFDDQEHQLGPVIYGELGDFSFETGVLMGVSEAAPDAELKAVVDYNFKF